METNKGDGFTTPVKDTTHSHLNHPLPERAIPLGAIIAKNFRPITDATRSVKIAIANVNYGTIRVVNLQITRKKKTHKSP